MLGKMNFAALARYIWKAADFVTWQNYLENLRSDFTSLHTQGVVLGCDISVVSGLSIQISAGLVIFPNGRMVEVAQQNLTLSAADPTNARIDRIELAYSLVNNSTVSNIDGNTVVLDQLDTGTAGINPGTASATPVAPTKTVGTLSLGLITVAGGQITLISGNIDETDDLSRDVSAQRFTANGLVKLKWNAARARFEVSTDGSTWSGLSTVKVQDISFAIPNNTAVAANIPGLSFDAAQYIGVKAKLMISLQDDIPTELVEFGDLVLVWRPKSATWDLQFPSTFDDAGVVLSITTTGTVGQVKFTSPNLLGANYLGKLRITDIVVQPV